MRVNEVTRTSRGAGRGLWLGVLMALAPVAGGACMASALPTGGGGSSVPVQGQPAASAVEAGEKGSMAQTTGTATTPIAADFSLEMSSGGGFTGVYQGNKVTADGKVVHWRSMPNGGPKKEEVLGTLEADALRRLVDAVNAAKFFDVKLDQPGNMTVSIVATMNGRTHVVRYPLPMDQHPDAVKPVVDAFRAEIKPLEKTRPTPE